MHDCIIQMSYQSFLNDDIVEIVDLLLLLLLPSSCVATTDVDDDDDIVVVQDFVVVDYNNYDVDYDSHTYLKWTILMSYPFVISSHDFVKFVPVSSKVHFLLLLVLIRRCTVDDLHRCDWKHYDFDFGFGLVMVVVTNAPPPPVVVVVVAVLAAAVELKNYPFPMFVVVDVAAAAVELKNSPFPMFVAAAVTTFD